MRLQDQLDRMEARMQELKASVRHTIPPGNIGRPTSGKISLRHNEESSDSQER